MRRPIGLGLAISLVAMLVACDAPPVAPGSSAEQQFFGRQLIIPVVNESNLPAVLFVAEDESPMGDLVGVAQPNVVPPRSRRDVIFTVPQSAFWAIFVNPSAEQGPLLLESELRRCVGRLPIEIGIGRDGSSYYSSKGEWCGES